MSDAQLEHLVRMAQQIARNMAAEGDEDAVARKTAEHLRKFWTPAMRELLLERCRQGGDALPGAVVRAAHMLSDDQSA